jgi:hypothetical protein
MPAPAWDVGLAACRFSLVMSPALAHSFFKGSYLALVVAAAWHARCPPWRTI